MLSFIKKRKARFDLDVALKALLLGKDKTEVALKERYKDRWDGFIEDVVNGAKAEDEALSLVTVYLLDVMDNEMAGEELRRMVDAIFNKQFVERPAVFDLIDQVGYFAILAEKSGEATKGTAALFLNKITRFFGDSEEVQNMTSEYFAESITRFRHSFQSAVKQGN